MQGSVKNSRAASVPLAAAAKALRRIAIAEAIIPRISLR
jgi:hypothetical protein